MKMFSFCLTAVLCVFTVDADITRWTAPITSTFTSDNVVTGVDSTGGPSQSATIIVSELTRAGTEVVTVSAISSVPNPKITYTLTDGTNTFGIRTRTYGGSVYLHCTNLDYTWKESYTVTIEATDSSATGATVKGTLTLTIRINAAPVISGGRVCDCSIATGTVSGETLHTFAVSDANPGDSRDGLLSGNTDSDWELRDSGALVTKKILNKQVNKCYDLVGSMTDSRTGTGGHIANALVTVTVKVSVGNAGTGTSCSCSDGAAAVVGGMLFLLTACVAQIM